MGNMIFAQFQKERENDDVIWHAILQGEELKQTRSEVIVGRQ